MKQQETLQKYGLNQRQIPAQQQSSDYGEIFVSSFQSNGALEFVPDFKGKQIINLSGGNRKMFLFEEYNQNQNIVTALHSQIQDQIQHQNQAVLPIDEVVMSLEGSKINQIKCGKYHNIILNQYGNLYSYGKGEFGSLGLGGSIFEPRPRLIKKLQNRKIVSIACGMFHTLALSNFGDLYSWGRGFEGQLGLLNSVDCASSPQYIPHFFKYDHSQNIKRLKKNAIHQIACGAYHSIAIDQHGSVYCWGQARLGQTGTGKKVKQNVPIKLKIQKNGQAKKSKKIAGGFGHTLCLTENGQLFAWGLNVKGQVGLSDLPESIKANNELSYTRAVFQPTYIQKSSTKQILPPFVTVSCGFCNSFALDYQGNAWVWGGGNLGFKDKFLERGPVKLSEGTQTKRFTKIFANENSVVLFAPLFPLFFKPALAPSNGATQITFFGNGFANTGNQHARFKIQGYQKQVSLEYDQLTSTYFCKAPNFSNANILYPCECQIELTLDKIKYFKYQKKLLLYSSKLAMESFQPKFGSATGETEIKIYFPLHSLILKYVQSISVGFKSTSKEEQVQAKYQDWLCSQGTYSEEIITCKLPNIPLFKNQQPFYLMDVSLNGQQFTEHHQTFRFYSISDTTLHPSECFQTGQIQVIINGKGLFDTPHKQLVLSLNFTHEQQTYNCKKTVQIKWKKIQKQFIFKMPSLPWMIGDHIITPQLLEEARKSLVSLVLYLGKNQAVDIGKFKFIIPPPPEEPEQQVKKDSKKDAKKGAKK